MTLGSSRSADVTVSIAPRAIAKATLAAVVLVAMVLALRATRSVIANIAIAAVIACLLRPGVLLLSRRMRTGLAIVAVYGAFLAGLVALLIADASALHTGATELRHFAPDRLAQLQQNLPPGNALRRFLIEGDVVARIRTYVNSIPSRFLFGTSSPLQGASQVAVILLIISLSGFMISRGPSIFHSVVSSLPTRWQPGVAAAGRDGYNTGGAYIRRTIVLCFPCALAASGLALACGVPGVGVLGVWVGMWAVIPRLGIAVGGLPLAALAFGQGTLQGTGALAGLAVIVVAGEAARVRWIERPTVKVGPFFSLVAVMAGMELGRWWGALVLLTAAAFFAAASDGRRIGDAGPEPAGELPEGSGGKETTSVAPASAPLSPTRSRISIDIDGWSLVLAAGLAFVVVVIIAFGRALPQSLTRLIVAVFFALALNRLVGLVQRRLGGRRGLAVAAVTVVFVAGLVAFSIFAIPQAVQQSRNVGSQAQSLVTQLDSAPIIGSRFRQSGLDDRLRNGLSDLPHILATHDQALSDGARSAGEAAVAFGWILLIGIGALLDGPEIARRFSADVPSSRRDQVERLGSLTYDTVGRSAAAKGFSALLQGSVVMVIALAFGVPLAPMLGAIAAIGGFIPQIGGAIAGVPLFVVALSQGLWTGIICGLLFLIYMELNNHVLGPLIVGRAVRISPLTSLIAVLIGVSLAGFIGGFLATPIAGLIQALWNYREPKAAALPE